jgi:hypothetical protein
MQTSRFHLGLIATLAIGLGFSLASSEAVGYPAVAAISLGSNPVWSAGGQLVSGPQVVATAESGDLIITDISFGANDNGWWRADFSLADTTLLAAFRGQDLHTKNFLRSLESGIRVPEGEQLSLVWGSAGAASNFAYTVSGYYAQP